jgi:hypothetical protein
VCAGVGKLAGRSRVSAAWVEPPCPHTLSRDPAQIERERPALRVVDEGVTVTTGGHDVVSPLQLIRHKRLIGNPRQNGTGFNQLAYVTHLVRRRAMKGFKPVQQWTIDRIASGSVHLPYGMISISMSACP